MAVLFALLLLVAVFVVYFLLDEVIRSQRLPPGPFPLPIIGNIHLLSDKPYLDLHRLVSRYGPVFRLRIGCNRVVVVNNLAFAKEAMNKRGADFAGRASQFAGDLFSRKGKGIGWQGYTRQLKIQRKTIIQTIRKFEKSSKLEEIVGMEVQDLVSRVSNKQHTADLHKLRADITNANCNIATLLAFGERFNEKNQEFTQLFQSLTVFAKALAATGVIDAFPLLKHMPFKIIDKLKEACIVRDKMLGSRYMQHKNVFMNKTYFDTDDLTYALLEEAEKSRERPEQLTEDHVVMTINDVIIAGSESPSTNMLWIIYFLIKHPEMQQRMQHELDEVIGRHRPPKWSDRQHLPYLEAFTTESMRHGNAMPLAIPHLATADSFLGPYQIPKGTTVLLNLYAIHHDPETWHNPHELNPDRFLNSDGSFNTDASAKVIPYGIGHRSCPGEQLSRMGVFMFTSSLLQNFTFAVDENEMLPDIDDGTFGIVLRPPFFKVQVIERS